MNAIEPRPVPETVTFLKLPVDMRKLYGIARDRGWGWHRHREHFDEGRALHHALTETFGQKSLSVFRLLVAPGWAKGALYAYSTLPIDELRQSAKLHGLDYVEALGLKEVEDMSLPTRFAAGHRLAFDIRIRPVVRLLKPLANPREPDRPYKKGAELDAFLVEANRQHPDARPIMIEGGSTPSGMLQAERTREAVYRDWLAERLKRAANLELDDNGIPTAKLVRFGRAVSVRRDSEHKNRGSEGPDATIQGTLVVQDEAAFAALLANGVGRHKAYGYGMLLLRPASRRPPLER